MDTDEALARALDEVLSLSGGDPRKGKYFYWLPYKKTNITGAMDALNAR